MNATIFAVLWQDCCLGGMPLTLRKATADEAVSTALAIRGNSDERVVHVRAVRVDPDDTIHDLLPAA